MMRVVVAMTSQAIHRQRRLRHVLGDVTGLAVEVAVSSSQRIARLRVMVIAPALPTVRVVTKRAVQSQATFMMLVAVAGVAIQRRALKLQRTMAFFASYDGVASDQRKSSDIVIEGCCSTPAGLTVTLLAATSKLALMLVVLLVTRQTGGCQFIAIEIAGMAKVALDLRMRGSQGIFRLVMIEMNRFPLVLVVAGLALGAVASGMNVLNLVAIHT